MLSLNLPCASPSICKAFPNNILGLGPGNLLKSASDRYLATNARIANVINDNNNDTTATAI